MITDFLKRGKAVQGFSLNKTYETYEYYIRTEQFYIKSLKGPRRKV